MCRNTGIKIAVATIVLVGCFIISPSSQAEQKNGYSSGFEYKEYIVKPGDTLWSISRRELEDAFQWPMVWRENLKINNPDEISPGQIIIIPIRVIEHEEVTPEAVVIEQEVEETSQEVEMPEQEEAPEVVTGEVRKRDVQRRPMDALVSADLLLAAGYITRSMPDAGAVEAAANGRLAFGKDDEIYVRTRERSRPGQKFYVIKDEAEVRHPVTKKRLGQLAKVAGVVVVDESGRERLKARVLDSYDLIQEGDHLDYYYDISPPFLVGEPRRPQVSGNIIASNYMRIINGTYDIVFLDKGSDQGLRLGDILMTLQPGTDDRMSSVVQLVNIRKETSLGVILKAVSEVSTGDIYRGIRE